MRGFNIIPDPNKFRLEPGASTLIYPIEYGPLFNWYAVNDAREITTNGWRVPTRQDFWDLMQYLSPGGLYNNNIAGIALKDIDNLYWELVNNGTNSSNFNGRGYGRRSNIDGTYLYLKRQGLFWNSEEFALDTLDGHVSVLYSTFYAIQYSESLGTSNPTNINQSYSAKKKSGLSIRPIKDTTALTHGQTGTYIGNDGKTYRTICIGTQEWLADNLCETKYRDGSSIPEVTDNAAWAALTTGALCAYNNDWANV